MVKELERKIVQIDTLKKVNLSRFFKKKKLVAIGEPNHYSKEVFNTKADFFKFLVQDLGYTIFGLEENFASCLAINEYVLNGEGDPNKLIKLFYSWPWINQELLDLIKWMRSYNLSKPKEKVKFYGFDMQQGYPARISLNRYFSKVDPSFYQMLDTVPVVGYMAQINYKMDTTIIKEIRSVLSKNQLHYQKKSSNQEWKAAWQNTNILLQQNSYNHIHEVALNTSYWKREGMKFRDKCMAENVQWISENEKPKSKMMIWAHNAHVSKGRYPSSVDSTMGEFLKHQYGEKYYTIGIDFSHGEIHDLQSNGLEIYSFEVSEENEFTGILKEKNASRIFLDFEFGSKNSSIKNWLTENDYKIKYNNGYSEIRLSTMFDALIYLDKVSPSTLLIK